MAINSLQVWTNADAGLRELHRVMKSGGVVAFGFTRHSGQSKQGLMENFAESGFADVRIVDKDRDFCLLATKP